MLARITATWSTDWLLWKRKGCWACWGKWKKKASQDWPLVLLSLRLFEILPMSTAHRQHTKGFAAVHVHARTLSRHVFRYDAGFNLIITTDNVSSTPLADLNQITSILLLQHWLRGYSIIALLFSPNCWILTLNVTTLPCLLHQICSRCRRISLGLSLKVMSGFYVVVLLVCGWP